MLNLFQNVYIIDIFVEREETYRVAPVDCRGNKFEETTNEVKVPVENQNGASPVSNGGVLAGDSNSYVYLNNDNINPFLFCELFHTGTISVELRGCWSKKYQKKPDELLSLKIVLSKQCRSWCNAA